MQRQSCPNYHAFNLVGRCPTTDDEKAKMKAFSKGPFRAIFWGGLLAGMFDITQAFVGFSLMGIHALPDFAANCQRHLWISLA